MRILCISAQKPDSTGSGVYLAETVASLAAAGHQVAVIAGIDKDDFPQLAPGVEFLPVRFRTPELPFPVCGMSDVMPYEATRYRDMTPEMVQAFRSVFGRRIREPCSTSSPMRSSAITCTWPALPRATCLTIWPVNIGHRLQKVGDARRAARARSGAFAIPPTFVSCAITIWRRTALRQLSARSTA